jgi:hypothetical protein
MPWRLSSGAGGVHAVCKLRQFTVANGDFFG